MRMIVCIFAVLLFCSIAFAESDVRTTILESKPGLDKPISLTLRAASIREALDKIEAETGVRLRPDRDVGDDKTTICVKKKPARDVLKALAHCFNLCWTESEIGSSRFLRLSMDKDSDAAMRRRHYEDYLVASKQFDTELKSCADYIRADTRYEVPPYNASAQTQDEYWRLQQRGAATQDPLRASMVLQCLNLSEAQRKDLYEGKEVLIEGGGIAEEAKKKYQEVTSFAFWIERSLGGYLLQGRARPEFSASTWTLLTMAMFDDSRYDKVVLTANETLLKDTALAKDLKPEKKPSAMDATVPAPADPSEQVAGVPKPGEGSGATPTTMSDGLLPIAEELGIPIVAQYISEYQPVAPSAPAKAGERLAQLCTQHKFTIERDGDFLLAKSMLWHRMRDREAPEEKIRRWQQSSAGLPNPTFETLVEMGNQSWGQVRGTINNGRYWLGMLDLSQIARCEYSLKLYASLNPTQKKALGEGAKITVSSLTPEQQLQFMQAYELKARPTYASAKDASWPRTAQFYLQDRGIAGAYLVAAAQMRTLASANLMDSIPADEKEKFMNMNEQQIYEYQTTNRKTADELISSAAKTLLDKVAAEHPEIARKSIGIYAQRACIFTMALETDQNSNYLQYFVRIL